MSFARNPILTGVALCLLLISSALLAAEASLQLPAGIKVEELPSDPQQTKIVLIAGSNFFKPGEHDYEAACAVLFDLLKPTLTGDAGSGYESHADRLGMTVGAVKVAVHRLRQRYRDRIREVIGRTVADPADVDDEIRDLFAALG